jgi:hypothetical protein
MQRDQQTVTTYHEAGHAVMAMANGFRVLEISNVANKVGRGFVRWASPDPKTNDDRWRSLLVLAAGMAADFIHWDMHGDDSNDVLLGHFDDQRQAREHLRALGQEVDFGVISACAGRFLRQQDVWEWVEAFADLLSAAGTINGSEILYRASQKVPRFSDQDVDHFRAVCRLLKQGKI